MGYSRQRVQRKPGWFLYRLSFVCGLRGYNTHNAPKLYLAGLERLRYELSLKYHPKIKKGNNSIREDTSGTQSLNSEQGLSDPALPPCSLAGD